MTALPPDLARLYLQELSADVRLSVVLSARGDLLSGDEAAAALARELLAAAPATAAALELQNRAEGDIVFAARSDEHAVVVVCGRFALPAVVLHDLRTVLADLDGRAREEPPIAPLAGRPKVPVARGLGWLRPRAAPIVRFYAPDGALAAPLTSDPVAKMLLKVAEQLSQALQSGL